MKSLKEYQDYRLYLKDLINAQRLINKKYSLIYYSKKIKTSESYLKQVVNNKRNLNLDKAYLLAKSLGLNSVERSYLLTLIIENEVKEPMLKRFFRNQLVEYTKGNISYASSSKMGVIFENNLLWEIFSLIGVNDFINDPRWIQNKLFFGATLSDIKAAIDFLLKINAIEIINNRLSAKNIIIPHRFNPTKAYIAALKRAIQFLQAGFNSNSTFESFCLIVSKDQYEEIQFILEETKIKINKMASKKEDSKTLIAYLNLNIFPVSK